MNEGTGDQCKDFYNIHGATITGAAWATGFYSNGITFGGANKYAVAAREASALTVLSFSCWIKLAATGNGNSGIVASYNSTLKKGFDFLISDGGGGYWQAGNGTTWPGAFNIIVPVGTVTANKWQFLVATAGAGANVYIDGVWKCGTASANPVSPVAAPVLTQIGGQGDGTAAPNAGWLYGTLDEVVIYNVELTPGMIQQLYKGSVGRFQH